MECDEEYDNGHTFTIYYYFKNSNYYHLHYDMMFPLYLGIHYRKSEEELKSTRLFMPVVQTKRLQVPWWRHQMETFSELLTLCEGNHQSSVNSPHKGQWRRALMFSLISAWTNVWANNRGAGDLIRNRTDCDVTALQWRHMRVMESQTTGNSTVWLTTRSS